LRVIGSVLATQAGGADAFRNRRPAFALNRSGVSLAGTAGTV